MSAELADVFREARDALRGCIGIVRAYAPEGNHTMEVLGLARSALDQLDALAAAGIYPCADGEGVVSGKRGRLVMANAAAYAELPVGTQGVWFVPSLSGVDEHGYPKFESDYPSPSEGEEQ